MKLRRALFSITILMVSLLTMVATTFAWVGIVTDSTFEEFEINLKTNNDTGDYGVQLSLSGRPDTFYDSIDSISLKRQILKNYGYNSNTIDKASEEYINLTFANVKLGQCTPQKNVYYPNLFESKEVQYFENVVDGYSTTKFFWFDVYASMYVAKTTASSNTPLALYLREGLLSSDDIGSADLLNPYKYPTEPYSLGTKEFTPSFLNKKFDGKVKVNPASAARVCVQTFEPIDLYNVALTEPIRHKIYQYDDVMPSYDPITNVYSFGGILPSKYNMAYQQYNLSHTGAELQDVPSWQVNRGDLTYADEGYTGCICYDGNNGVANDGLYIGKMVKFRIYFWFEGWDSDCFSVIDRRTVNVNLSFSNKAPFDI